MASSCSGLRWPKAPPAPESLPTRSSSAAASERVRLRCISEYQSRSLRPKVVGSAWMPWVRPMMGVCLNSIARFFKVLDRLSMPVRIKAEASRGLFLAIGPFVDVLGDGGGEGEDVVAVFGLDLVDAVDGEVATVADGVGGGLRYQAKAGKG